MHYYDHNIKTFNNATRHLTHVERALYRDAIELYYDTEQPLKADDFGMLCKKLMARNDDEKEALRYVLDEFFYFDNGVYRHEYCDKVLSEYKSKKG